MTTLPAGWKPISSAPKDGTEFLARWGRQGGSVEIVNWNRIHGHFASKGHALLGFESNATHWTPLPQFPGTHDAPITVSLDPDPRGVSVGVWQGSRCIYNGAHEVPVSAQDDAKDDITQRLRDNSDLDAAEDGNPAVIRLEREAADEIDRLRRALADAPAAGDARAVAALAELVACDNLKRQLASMQACTFVESDAEFEEMDRIMSDLARRQPAAWEAARAVVAASQQ